MTGLESAFAALVLAAFTRWLVRVAKKVMFPWAAWRQVPDPQAVLSEQALWQGEVDRLVGWLNSHPLQGTSHQAEVQRHVARVRNYLVRIPEEVFQDMRRVIVAGHNNGDGIEAIAAAIDDILRVSGSENWPSRAQTIAVTEVNGASNAAWFVRAVKEQQQLGVSVNKKWIASHDTHVRPSHAEADGQIVPLGSPFIVGTWPLLYPGDKNGPADEVINCRCTAAVVEGP